jgi:hypothetical protein
VSAKNIVLFVDGTGNSPNTNTNVYQLRQLCREPAKLQCYLAGVGTGPFDFWSGPSGAGTKSRLRDTYDFLTSNYLAEDNIFMFGFSRGAFAVRLLAGFLEEVGTLFTSAVHAGYLEHIYQIYEASVILRKIQEFRMYLRRLSDAPTEPLPIHFLGVWDTVEEYYLSRDLPDLEKLPAHVNHARQALALHERRHEMEPTLWTNWNADSTVCQRWFPGAHADVGGGYPDGGLADAPLRWMQAEASKKGLDVDAPPANPARRVLHQERTGGAVLGALVSRIKGEGPRRALLEPGADAMRSIEVDQMACDNLVDPIEICFTGGEGADARSHLDKINKATLDLLLQIKSHGKGEGWRAQRTLEEVPKCRPRINACFPNPPILMDKFSDSLALLVLLGGETDWIAQRLNKLSDDHVDRFAKALSTVKDMFSDWGVNVPGQLNTSIEAIEQRADEIRLRRDEEIRLRREAADRDRG